MKLSIIVPVYNMAGDGKLEYCLESLVKQTIAGREDYEIIAVDDASTDDSMNVLREYEGRYPNLIKIAAHSQNGRQGKAKNTGLKIASGEWVGFMDSDDWAAPDMYEKLLKKAEDTGADIVGCNLSRVSEHTMVPGEIIEKSGDEYAGLSGGDFRKKAAKGFGYMVLKIYRRSVIEENSLHFPEGIFYEDNCAGVIWPLYFEHFEKVDEPLYFYYQHDSSTVHTVTEERCLDRMRAMDLMYDEASERGLLEKYGEEINYRFIQLYFYVTLFSYMIGVKKKHFSFVHNLKKGLLKRVPDYGREKFYPQMFVYAEEEKMVRLCMKNSFAFYVYYNLLLKYRELKKKRPGK